MQNLSQNEFNQIVVMRGLSQDELEEIAEIREFLNISFIFKTKHS